MTEIKAVRANDRAPTSPAELLSTEVLPALGKSKVEIAKLLRISRQSLYDVLSGKQDVTPEMAVRLGKLCGNGPELWLNMQAAHNLWQAKKRVDVRDIPTLKAAAN